MHVDRITFVRRHWNPAGGAEHYLERLATRLSDRGIRCDLLCESWDHDENPFSKIHRVNTRPVRRTGCFADAANQWLADASGLPCDTAKASAVFSMERGVRANVYRAGDGVHACWLKRRPTGWIDSLLPKHRAQLQLESQTFSPDHTGRVIANSQLVRREILAQFSYPGERIDVITNPVDAARFSAGSRSAGRSALGLSDHEFVCLLVGRGAYRKGHRIAQCAVARLSFPARLVIIDSPPQVPLPDVYAAADVFLFPSRYDPFANVTLEAMAAGLPVITSSDNGASEVIHHGVDGFVVDDPNDATAFANVVGTLVHADHRAAIGSAAQQTARLHTWEKHIDATLEAISKSQTAKPASMTSNTDLVVKKSLTSIGRD